MSGTTVSNTNDLEVRVCDALAADINQNTTLPTHQTVLYRRPLLVLPEDCPVLCVWFANKAPVPRGTNYFDTKMTFGISWQVQAVEAVKTLVDDPERSKSLLKELGSIQQRMRYLEINGWSVTEAFAVTMVSLQYMPPGNVETGLVEGYSIAVQVSATEKG